jgi:hypothetical protein
MQNQAAVDIWGKGLADMVNSPPFFEEWMKKQMSDLYTETLLYPDEVLDVFWEEDEPRDPDAVIGYLSSEWKDAYDKWGKAEVVSPHEDSVEEAYILDAYLVEMEDMAVGMGYEVVDMSAHDTRWTRKRDDLIDP